MVLGKSAPSQKTAYHKTAEEKFFLGKLTVLL